MCDFIWSCQDFNLKSSATKYALFYCQLNSFTIVSLLIQVLQSHTFKLHQTGTIQLPLQTASISYLQ